MTVTVAGPVSVLAVLADCHIAVVLGPAAT